MPGLAKISAAGTAADSLRRLVNDVVSAAAVAETDSSRRLADAAAPADSTRRRRVELAQEATEREQRIVEEREQRIVELGVEAKRIIELGVEDLSSRNLLKLFEIADANIEVGHSKSKSVCAVFCL